MRGDSQHDGMQEELTETVCTRPDDKAHPMEAPAISIEVSSQDPSTNVQCQAEGYLHRKLQMGQLVCIMQDAEHLEALQRQLCRYLPTDVVNAIRYSLPGTITCSETGTVAWT